MARGSQDKMIRKSSNNDDIVISAFPENSQLETADQIRGFELLRLAFFALKLRKLEQRHDRIKDEAEYKFRCSLLRHAIFHQVVTLTRLDARDQAMHLIDACRK
ncbi:MAG: hypothetical protein JO011_08940 [Ktedonobacteraceae bacterium]|nr:hypothetical protein [Ktedonobacteraceae bacterium]